MQVVLAKDEKVLFPEATVYDLEQEKELNREVGRVLVEADHPSAGLDRRGNQGRVAAAADRAIHPRLAGARRQ